MSARNPGAAFTPTKTARRLEPDMTYQLKVSGESRSFPAEHPFLKQATGDRNSGLVIIGVDAGAAFRSLTDHRDVPFVAIELGTECLGVHTGEDAGNEGSNVVGFARFRLGDTDPSNLIELVKQPKTNSDALAKARAAFESAGLVVA